MQDKFLLSACPLCGDRFEKKSIEDKGEHVCPPSPQQELEFKSKPGE